MEPSLRGSFHVLAPAELDDLGTHLTIPVMQRTISDLGMVIFDPLRFADRWITRTSPASTRFFHHCRENPVPSSSS
jgi:hypothetical protein